MKKNILEKWGLYQYTIPFFIFVGIASAPAFFYGASTKNASLLLLSGGIEICSWVGVILCVRSTCKLADELVKWSSELLTVLKKSGTS